MTTETTTVAMKTANSCLALRRICWKPSSTASWVTSVNAISRFHPPRSWDTPQFTMRFAAARRWHGRRRCWYRRQKRQSLRLLDGAEQAFRVGGPGIERQRPLHLGAGGRRVLQGQVRLGENHVRGRGVFAPNRDLERLDGVGGAAGAEVNPA